MSDQKHEKIRQRAHQIWEDAGRPEGEHEKHWEQARAEIEGTSAKSGKGKGKAAAVKKTNGDGADKKPEAASSRARKTSDAMSSKPSSAKPAVAKSSTAKASAAKTADKPATASRRRKAETA